MIGLSNTSSEECLLCKWSHLLPTFYDLFYYTYYLLKIVEYSHFLKNHIGNPKKPITPKIADIKQNTTTILISLQPDISK